MSRAHRGRLALTLSSCYLARPQDYVYALLTGYVDPPAGVEIREGLNYNPYFPGGAIGMARVLYDGLVEYDDGTPATTSQMAKDVVSFLAWAAEPELDQRKKMGMQATIILSGLLALSIWTKKFKWAPIKSRKIVCASSLLLLACSHLVCDSLADSWCSQQTTRPRSSTKRLCLGERGRCRPSSGDEAAYRSGRCEGGGRGVGGSLFPSRVCACAMRKCGLLLARRRRRRP